MEYLFIATQLVHQIGLTFGIGASTFALAFYIAAMRDGFVDSSEKTFMHIVYFVLRIGMALITLSLISIGYLAYSSNALAYLSNPIYLMEVTIMAVIIVNAILMTIHKMPMWLGPVLAGGSWYSLFWVTSLPFVSVTYLELVLYYLAFVLVFFAGFTVIKNYFAPPAKPQI